MNIINGDFLQHFFGHFGQELRLSGVYNLQNIFLQFAPYFGVIRVMALEFKRPGGSGGVGMDDRQLPDFAGFSCTKTIHQSARLGTARAASSCKFVL